MNIGASWPGLDEARERVLGMQMKLHSWARADPGHRIDDLFNLVYDPAFLTVATPSPRGQLGAGAEGAGLDQGQGPAADSPSTTSNARGAAAPAQPGAAGLVQLLPPRRVQADLRLRRPLRLLASRGLASQTTPGTEHAHPGPSSPPRVGDQRRGIDLFRPNRFAVERYRYRGTKIPTPWSSGTTGSPN